jgi:hypothetical protein
MVLLFEKYVLLVSLLLLAFPLLFVSFLLLCLAIAGLLILAYFPLPPSLLLADVPAVVS